MYQYLRGGKIGNHKYSLIDDTFYTWIYNPVTLYALYKSGDECELEYLINHPALFEVYPNIRQLKVKFENGPEHKAEIIFPDEADIVNNLDKIIIKITLNFDHWLETRKEYITIDSPEPDLSREAMLLHELQHVLEAAHHRPAGISAMQGMGKANARTHALRALEAVQRLTPEQQTELNFYNTTSSKKLGAYFYFSDPGEIQARKTVREWLKLKGVKYTDPLTEYFGFDPDQKTFSKGGTINMTKKYYKCSCHHDDNFVDGGNIDNQQYRYFDFDIKSSNFDYKLVQDEIKHIISGTCKVKHGDFIQTISNYLRTVTQARALAKESKFFSIQETALLKQYINQNDLWVNDIDFSNSNQANRGFEQQVYFLNAHYVVKTNNRCFYISWQDYFNSLLLHNYFFPGTAYELIGFDFKDNKVHSVVKQKTVNATSLTDLEFVKEFLFLKGFIPERNNNYYHADLGIILEDLHDQNVLTEDGVLFFIDTAFFVKYPEMYLKNGGLVKKESDEIPESYGKRSFTLQEKREQFTRLKKEAEIQFVKDAPAVQEYVKIIKVPLKLYEKANIYRFLCRNQITLDMLPKDVLDEFKSTRMYEEYLKNVLDEQFKTGGKITEKQTTAKKSLQSISGDQHKGIKVSPAVLEKEETKLRELKAIEERADIEIAELHEQDKKSEDAEEKGKIWQKKRVVAALKALRFPALIAQTNVVKCIKNGGTLIDFTDKMGLEHPAIPDYRAISTDFIGFDQDTILNEPLPPYMPLINEEVFKGKGYIFDVIRIEPDGYIVAINGYERWVDKKWNSEIGDYTGTIHPTDAQQGYILVTLDQLALINEYYIVKSKALLQKKADEDTAKEERYYDNLPREKRLKHFDQPGYYRAVPAAVKKKVTESQWNSFTLEEKESYYKPFKKYGPKRMETRLEETKMWSSFHYMFNRFVDPEALPYKKDKSYTTYGHDKAFEYWEMFRDFLNWKLKDIKVQRETISEIRMLAIETSFGESNTNDVLKEEYGILVKRQDGSQIKPAEIDQVEKAWIAVNKTFGNLSELARTNNLKISHTGTKYVFSSKAAGMYVPDKQTIAVSNKFGDHQFNSTMAHEVSHWIDHKLGLTKGKRHATDDFESTAGQIARIFRKNMNQMSDSDYTNATLECFSRAMEQYFAISEFGDGATLIYSGKPLDAVRTYFTEDNYVGKSAFESQIKPLIKKFLTEHADFLNYALPVE